MRGFCAAYAGCVGLVMAALSAQPAQSQPAPPGAQVQSLRFDQLPGWEAAPHGTVFAVFARSCAAPQALRDAKPRSPALQAICDQALAFASSRPADAAARAFFETHFHPWSIQPVTAAGQPATGFLTGYFEPEFDGALSPSAQFSVPLYARPPDLVTRPNQPPYGADWDRLGAEFQAARQTLSGLEPYLDRQAIESGALAGKGLELLWLRDGVDRFVMQVQGSARIRLADGTVRRVAYAGRNGYPYTSLGRVLVEEEGIPAAQMTMDKLVARLKADLDAGQRLIWRNRSFVFFRLADELALDLGPIGGEGVPLTPDHSVAADRLIWPYGTPVMLNGVLPDAAAPPGSGQTRPLSRFAVIQDTGSAIVGAARVDLFFGSGADAGHMAGLVRHPMALTVLWPRATGGN
jgi:membrane-bound lytic murein transglycosylase A